MNHNEENNRESVLKPCRYITNIKFLPFKTQLERSNNQNGHFNQNQPRDSTSVDQQQYVSVAIKLLEYILTESLKHDSSQNLMIKSSRVIL